MRIMAIVLAALLCTPIYADTSQEWDCWRWAAFAESVQFMKDSGLSLQALLESIDVPQDKMAEAKRVTVIVYQGHFDPDHIAYQYYEWCEAR